MNIGTGILKIVATSVLLGSISPGAVAAGLSQVHGNVPAVVAKAQFMGHHNPSAPLNVSVALPLQHMAQLTQFMHDLQDRSSSSFHRFLKPGEFKTAYGPTDAQVAAVKNYLIQQGIPAKNISWSGNNTRVYATASTAVMEAAFGVAINDYKLNGVTFYSASGDPSVPAALGVKAVFGLDDAVQWQAHNIQNLHPAPHAGAGPSGFSPLQIATAYDWPDITNPANGAGVTIAIATAFTYRPQDITKFWDTYGLPHHTLSNTPINGTTHVLNGETTLDIERSSSMAPGADIQVYECSTPANANFDAEFALIASNDTEQVVTTSWGLSEAQTGIAGVGAEHDSFVEMAGQGQVVLAAAGDNGAADRATGSDNADFPSSDPFVISAGGTSLTLNGGSIDTEVAWSGAGGADSIFFAEPVFETATAGWVSNTNCSEDVTSDTHYTGPGHTTGVCTAAGNASRQNSDMALDANPGTGYSIYYNGRWEVFGGTSFVAPELAGLFANLVQQNSGFSVGPGPALVFCVANDGNYATTFHDITAGNNGFPAGTGWDHPTGWGTPDATVFISEFLAHCD